MRRNRNQSLKALFYILIPLSLSLFSPSALMAQSIKTDSVNSVYDEQNPVLSPDGNRLYFVRSSHPQNQGGVLDKGDIWFIEKDSAGWSAAQYGGKTINHKGLNGVVGFSEDGNHIYLLNYKDAEGGLHNGISRAEWVKDHWSVPQKLSIRYFSNNSAYISATISANEKVMIISYKGFDTFGNEDLYVTFKESDGGWSMPQNLGVTVNTDAEEWSPFLSRDMQTLYFSSNGHGGFGSRDLFMTKRLNNSWTDWSIPVNLGAEVNTEGTELGYFIPNKGELAYYSSTQNSEGFGDIVSVPLSEVEKEVQKLTVETPKDEVPEAPEIPSTPVVVMTMQVLDVITEQPIDALVKLTYSEKEMEINTGESGSPEKKFLVTLEENADVSIEITADGYFMYKETFTASSAPLSNNLESRSVEGFKLTPKEIGAKIKIENVLFEQGSATFSDPNATADQLDHLVLLMENNPEMEIRLEGHTDNRGNPKLLKTLSQDRVDAVKEYLVSKGIANTRIQTIGLGAENPVADNTSDTGRERNRRVEFVIVK